MHNFDTRGNRRPVGSHDVVDEDRDIRVHRGRCISGHKPDLTAGVVGEVGDPTHIHHNSHSEDAGVFTDGGGDVIDAQNGGDPLDLHTTTESSPPIRVQGTLNGHGTQWSSASTSSKQAKH